jgi:Uma2 family endonuclease
MKSLVAPGESPGRLSADDLLKMPHSERRLELVRGELRAAEPAGGEHGAIAMRVGALLDAHVRARGLGRIFAAETGFIISRDPDTVRAPDVAFVARRRVERFGLPRGFWPGAPDLAVEVLSPEDRPGAVREKVEGWLRAGCEVVLVVDPERRLVTVQRSPDDSVVIGGDEVIDTGDVVPGWRMRVADVFAVE